MAEGEAEDGLHDLIDEDELGDEYNKFLQSLHRVKIMDDRGSIDQVHEMLKEDGKKIDVDATKIFLMKELEMACQEQQNQQSEAELDRDITNLQKCSVNATGVQFTVHNTAIYVQLQEELQQQMSDAAEVLNPTVMSVMSSSHQTMESSVVLAELLADIDAKQLQLLVKRKKLIKLQSEVRELWQVKEEQDLTKEKRSDTQDIINMRQKLQSREGRVEILIHFLQTLITGLSTRWGKDAYLLKILQACELYRSSSHNWNSILELLTK